MDRIMKLTALKIHIIKSKRTQREVGLLAKIPEGKFSHLITGRIHITQEERRALCNILKIKDADLFKELY